MELDIDKIVESLIRQTDGYEIGFKADVITFDTFEAAKSAVNSSYSQSKRR